MCLIVHICDNIWQYYVCMHACMHAPALRRNAVCILRLLFVAFCGYHLLLTCGPSSSCMRRAINKRQGLGCYNFWPVFKWLMMMIVTYIVYLSSINAVFSMCFWCIVFFFWEERVSINQGYFDDAVDNVIDLDKGGEGAFPRALGLGGLQNVANKKAKKLSWCHDACPPVSLHWKRARDNRTIDCHYKVCVCLTCCSLWFQHGLKGHKKNTVHSVQRWLFK